MKEQTAKQSLHSYEKRKVKHWHLFFAKTRSRKQKGYIPYCYREMLHVVGKDADHGGGNGIYKRTDGETKSSFIREK